MKLQSREPESTHHLPCGLYVHVPFCESKCGYCDFYSVGLGKHDPAGLLERVARELRTRLRGVPHRVQTIFVGGGTPSVLPTSGLTRLLEGIRRSVRMQQVTEFTVEANPATVDRDKAKLLVDNGVTRVSLGAQSFLPSELAVLERLHTPDDIAPSVTTLRRHGVPQINLDLIFGVPGQTLDTWSQSLVRAIDLRPDHIACYGLTYEPGTRLTAQRNAGRLTPCDEALEADLYLHAIDTLAAAGYEQYETSNFAKPGGRCRHNLIYWRNGPYIGVGPSAAGCLSRRRYKNVADVAAYVRLIDAQGHAEAESEIVDEAMLMTEMLMMQLRLVEGLSINSFREQVGVDPRTCLGHTLDRLTEDGLLAVSETHIALTRSGRLVSDALMAELVGACHGYARPLASKLTGR